MFGHFNHGMDDVAPAGKPYGVGDYYYSQDLAKDFYYLLKQSGKLKELFAEYPALISGGVVTLGAAAWQVNISAFVALLEYAIQVADGTALWAMPPDTKNDVLTVILNAAAQTNLVINVGGDLAPTADGTTTNYLWVKYSEVVSSNGTRTRAKGTGSYSYELEPTPAFGCGPSATMGNTKLLLAKLTVSAGGVITILPYVDSEFERRPSAIRQDNIRTMTAGRFWDPATLPSSAYWYSIAFGNGRFVAVAYGSDKAAYSTDGGVTWTAATLPSPANWRSDVYGNGRFVAVASGSNKAAYSTDGGATWTASTLPSSANWYSIAFGNGRFVTVDYGSDKAAYSSDGGATWTAATLPSSADWRFVAYGNGRFVAVAYGSDKAAYSTDGGATWTAATLPSSADWRSVVYGNGRFVAIAYNSNKSAYSSDGGATWTAATLPSSENWYSIVYGNGRFVAIAYNSNKAAYSF